MGGVVVILAGDFIQILHGIPKSKIADELNPCLNASHLWRHVKKLTLTTNTRVLAGDGAGGMFAGLLLTLGNGKSTSGCTDCTETISKQFQQPG